MASINTSREAVERVIAGLYCNAWCPSTDDCACNKDAATLRALLDERDAWMETARHHLNNEMWLRGLLDQVGQRFGADARRSDDGTDTGKVLLLRVPECVATLEAERDRLREALQQVSDMGTEFANATVRRICNHARAALGEGGGDE